MSFVEAIGLTGNILLALCSLPLVYKALKYKEVEIDTWFLIIWSLGEVLGLIYILSIPDFIVAINYLVNVIGLGIVWKYKK